MSVTALAIPEIVLNPGWDERLPDWQDDAIRGTIYLLHFIDPVTREYIRFGHAGHYLGWSSDLPQRLLRHGTKKGANLLWYARQAGIGWELARTWEGTRLDERRLKAMGGLGRRCPLCGIRPMANTVRKRASAPAAPCPDGNVPITHVLR